MIDLRIRMDRHGISLFMANGYWKSVFKPIRVKYDSIFGIG
jgi:hypothetical protein